MDGLVKNDRDSFFWSLCVGLLFLFVCFSLFISLRSDILIRGDGYEYIAQVEAWLNHQSMDIREEDYLSVSRYYGEEVGQRVHNWLQVSDVHKYFAISGKQYAPHFGGYAAFVAPIVYLFELCGFNPLNGFLLTNIMLYFIALLTVFAGANISLEQKFYLLLFLIINPAVFYLTWQHTEVYSYAFSIMGLVFFYRKKHKVSIFLISMAAMQNIGLMFLGMAVGLDYWRKIIVESQQRDVQNKILFGATLKKLFMDYTVDIFKAGLCYFPGLLPVIHTWINFREINLVASTATENAYLLEKAWAYWTDLNLGIIPYVPLVVLLSVIELSLLLRKNAWCVFLHLLALGGIYYILAHQLQINSDMYTMARYNVWVLPILLFFVVYNGDVFSWSVWYKRTLVVSIIITLGVLGVASGSRYGQTNVFSHLDFAPWSKLVLKYAPEIYNPYHGIFISRTSHEEMYQATDVVIYRDSDGYTRKILIPEAQMLDVNISGSNEDKEWLNGRLLGVEDKKYQYISIPYSRKIRTYKVLDEFNPQIMDNQDTRYLLKGVHGREGDFCWTEPEVEIGFNPKVFDGKNLVVEYMLHPIIVDYVQNEKYILKLYINGELLKTVDMAENGVGEKYQTLIVDSIDLPEVNDDIWYVELKTNACFNPYEFGYGSDNRNLSLRLRYIGAE